VTLKRYFFGIRNDKDNAIRVPKLEAFENFSYCALGWVRTFYTP
jgi:hypothetical protein